jgi:hypothetical protein
MNSPVQKLLSLLVLGFKEILILTKPPNRLLGNCGMRSTQLFSQQNRIRFSSLERDYGAHYMRTNKAQASSKCCLINAWQRRKLNFQSAFPAPCSTWRGHSSLWELIRSERLFAPAGAAAACITIMRSHPNPITARRTNVHVSVPQSCSKEPAPCKLRTDTHKQSHSRERLGVPPDASMLFVYCCQCKSRANTQHGCTFCLPLFEAAGATNWRVSLFSEVTNV